VDAQTTPKLPWEAPATVALTDTDSRADQPDVALRNGTVVSD
jgi:hypothetical protein